MASSNPAPEHERTSLLTSTEPSRPSYESHASYQSLRDVGATDLGASIESLPSNTSANTISVSRSRGWGIVASLGLLIFLQASNISLLTTTQGVIAEALDAFEEASWFTSAYLVASASISPVSGKLSYIVTPRICMFVSTIILALGSLITGLAPSLAVFLLGRATSGVGAAGVLSVAIILVVQLTTPQNRGLYTGILNSGFTVGVAFGATVAGALEPRIGWRALFWAQTPLAIIGGIGLMISIPAGLHARQTANSDQKKSVLRRLAAVDYLGALLLILTIVSLLYGLSTPKVSYVPIIISACIFPLFIAQEVFNHVDPIIPVAVLRSRGALLSNLSTLGFMMCRWAVLFYSPIYAAAVRGWVPAAAGSILIPTNIGFALGGLLSGGVHIRRAGNWYIACLAIYAIFPITLLALSFAATQYSSKWTVIVWIFANGACAGAALNYTLHHVLHLVLPDIRFIVTSLLATFRGFAGTFGSAIGGGIFVRVLQRSLEDGFKEHRVEGRRDLIRRLTGYPRAVQQLEGIEKEIAIAAYTKAIQTLFVAGVGLSLVMLLVQAGTGWESPVEERLDEMLTEPDESNERPSS